jgi:O-antigen/teichoic acid export membrane protein
MLSNLQLRPIQATDVGGEYSLGEYLGLRLVTTAVAFAVIGVVAVGSSNDVRTALVLLGVGLSKCFEAISDGLQGFLQRNERMDMIAKSMMIKGVLALGLATMGLLATRTLVGAVAGLCLGCIAILVCYDVPCCAEVLGDRRGIRPNWGLRRLWGLAWLALPLGVVQMLVSLSASLPRYFLQTYRGPEELGIFAALACFIVAGQTVVSALGQSSSPRLARYFAACDYRSFGRLLTGMVVFGVIMGLVGVLVAAVAGHGVLLLVYQRTYAEHAGSLVLMMLTGTAAYAAWFLGFGMTAARSFRAQLPVLAASTLATLGACRWLVPARGIDGATLAMGVGMGVLAIGSLAVVVSAVRRSSPEVGMPEQAIVWERGFVDPR